MNFDDVLMAVDAGRPVKWANDNYDVIKDKLDRYLVVCNTNGYTTHLYESDASGCYIEVKK